MTEQPLELSVVQFESRSEEKEYNLSMIEKMAREAAIDGSEMIAFHECCISGYSHARHLEFDELLKQSESVPDGPSIQRLMEISRETGVAILAGLFERDEQDRIYNSYICVDGDELKAVYRKLHPFIHPELSAGDQYVTFELRGWSCGILICYDNNIIENVRATNLLGADILFMPHVTMCTPSTRPGAGFVDPDLWDNRHNDPTTLREEFDSLKGRAWLMKWLPARAYDNATYVVFSNPIGMEGDQLKNGCSMIIDPFGDVIAECRNLGNDRVSALATPEKLIDAGGYRYKKARRPDLYRTILGQDHRTEQQVSWLHTPKKERNE
ncbi:MAG: nitrilase family protein [Balneolaceae bacterium]